MIWTWTSEILLGWRELFFHCIVTCCWTWICIRCIWKRFFSPCYGWIVSYGSHCSKYTTLEEVYFRLFVTYISITWNETNRNIESPIFIPRLFGWLFKNCFFCYCHPSIINFDWIFLCFKHIEEPDRVLFTERRPPYVEEYITIVYFHILLQRKSNPKKKNS